MDPVAVPYFVELAARHDLRRGDVIVYGVICACKASGYRPTIKDIARIGGFSCEHRSRGVKYAIARLEMCGLVTRKASEVHNRATFSVNGPGNSVALPAPNSA